MGEESNDGPNSESSSCGKTVSFCSTVFHEKVIWPETIQGL